MPFAAKREVIGVRMYNISLSERYAPFEFTRVVEVPAQKV